LDSLTPHDTCPRCRRSAAPARTMRVRTSRAGTKNSDSNEAVFGMSIAHIGRDVSDGSGLAHRFAYNALIRGCGTPHGYPRSLMARRKNGHRGGLPVSLFASLSAVQSVSYVGTPTGGVLHLHLHLHFLVPQLFPTWLMASTVGSVLVLTCRMG